MKPTCIFIIAVSSQLAVANQLEYDDHTFGLKSKDSAFVLEAWLPRKQTNYYVHNIGRVKVNIELWYGMGIKWLYVVCGATVYPGTRKMLDCGGRPLYSTGLKLYNDEADTRAIVHADGGDLSSAFIPPDLNINKWLRIILTIGIKRIPLIGKTFTRLLKLFWPEDKPNAWKNVLEKIRPILEEEEMAILESIIINYILVYKDKIISLQNEMKTASEVKQHYMNIAESLVGFEHYFSFSNVNDKFKTINFRILPLFSLAVSMKMNFYLLGIRNKVKINLNDNDIINIKQYMNMTLLYATDYIYKMRKDALNDTYETSEAAGIFNNMMTVRSYLAVHGEEYLPIWNQMLNDPFSNNTPASSVISYSDFFGRPTSNLYAQATPVEVIQPLNPMLIGEKRNKLVSVEVYTGHFRDSEYQQIGGMKLVFKNQDQYMLGTYTNIAHFINLNETTINHLTGFGEESVDGLKFCLADGRNLTFGTVTSASLKHFGLPNHHIVSLYLDSEDPIGQAINLAVSYQMNNK